MTNELGTDTELLALVAKIQGFNHDTATNNESLALAKALKIIADDVVVRHEAVRRLQVQLSEKLAIASVAGELAGVLTALKPAPLNVKPRRWYHLWR